MQSIVEKTTEDKQYLTCAETAKLIRAALKEVFPGQKFSVTSKTYSGGASARVNWTDGPTAAEVDKVVGRFAGASFDGMTDLKSYKTGTLDGRAVHFGADYVFTEREFSAAFLRRVTLETCAEYGHDELPLVSTYLSGGAYISGPACHVPYCVGASVTLEEKIMQTAREMSLYTRPEPKRADLRLVKPAQTGEAFTVTRSGNWTWVRFADKPSKAILLSLKAAGAKWSHKRVAWYFSAPVEISIDGERVTVTPASDLAAEMAALDELHTESCDLCGREFQDESAELARAMVEAHKLIAHKPDDDGGPDSTPYIPDEHADAGASLRQSRNRADFRRGETAAHSETIITAFRQWCDGEAYYDNTGNYRLRLDGEPRRVAPWNKEVKRAFKDVSEFARAAREMFPREPKAATAPETAPQVKQAQKEACTHADAYTFGARAEGGKEIQYGKCDECGSVERVGPQTFTASRETLRALKLINDANVLEEKRNTGKGPSDLYRSSLAFVCLGDVRKVLDVAKLDKWAATFNAGDTFTFELAEDALTLTRGASMIKFTGGSGFPFSFAPIELTASESGEVVAPQLPDAESMKQARKELAAGRKALNVERTRVKAAQSVNSAKADLQRCEEYAERLDTEAREALQRAEELTEEDCEEALTLARRVRDLRRLRREVERAAEDPQINTPGFFEWVTDEHKAAYAESFTVYEKAREKMQTYKPTKPWGRHASAERGRRHKATNEARRKVRNVLMSAFETYVQPFCAELFPDEDALQFSRVFCGKFDTEAQSLKRALRQFPRKIREARKRIAEAREIVRESLEAYRPHVPEGKQESYRKTLEQFTAKPRELSQAA